MRTANSTTISVPDERRVKDLIKQGKLPAPSGSIGGLACWDLGGLAEMLGTSRSDLIRTLSGISPRFCQMHRHQVSEFGQAA